MTELNNSKPIRDAEGIRKSSAKWLSIILTEKRKNKELSDIEESHIRQMCSVLLWKFSEAQGSKKNNPYWSDEARKRENLLDESELIHEHVVPRNEIIKFLFKLEKPSYNEVRDVLNKFCIGVVVTKSEDALLRDAGFSQKMPKNWDEKDAFARYTHIDVNIKVTVHTK